MSNETTEEILRIINKKLSSSQSNIFQLRKDFEQLYLEFSSKQELVVEKQTIDDISGFKICAENAQDNYIILFFHGGGFITGSQKIILIYVGNYPVHQVFMVLVLITGLHPNINFPLQWKIA